METAHKTDEEKKEYFDSEEELNIKIDQLAQWISESKHFVTFTGAGISTAAGISDYRSGVNTVLKVGPGVWEKKKHGITETGKKTDAKQLMQKAFPTITHLALAQLMQENYLKFVISQNVDGLHLKSGIPADKIAELHGNTNLEICSKCSKNYFRDYKVRNNVKVHDHKTGRKCFDCKGDLNDSIINFNENLRDEVINEAWAQAQKADLMLCLGSSLSVTPAADMPAETIDNGGKVVVVNLQKTPYYSKADFNIFAKIEDVMGRLMLKMNIEVPNWNFVEIKVLNKVFTLSKEPFVYKFSEYLKNNDNFEIKFHFYGNYFEPIFVLSEKFGNFINKVLKIEYDPFDKIWIKTIY
jgi:NAD-dependent SIR2 family protein deacetylase